MALAADVNAKLKNIASPFTEIFSLLVKRKGVPDGFLTLVYSTDELVLMLTHIDNAIEMLLHGAQNLGQLMSSAMHDESQIINELKDLGYLYSAIANMVEALHSLRLEADYVLKQREVVSLNE